MGRNQDSLNSFAQAADIDPDFTEAWYNKGMALMEFGKYLEAIRAFDTLLKIDPHNGRAHENGIWHRRKSWSLVIFPRSLQGNKRSYPNERYVPQERTGLW